MKFYRSSHLYTQLTTIILLFFSITKINSNSKTFILKMESICSKAEDYINVFFNEYETIDEKIKNYCPIELLTKNSEEILKMVFFDENAKKSYVKKKFRFLEIFRIIFLVLLIISVVIIIIFDNIFLLSFVVKLRMKKIRKLLSLHSRLFLHFIFLNFFYYQKKN